MTINPFYKYYKPFTYILLHYCYETAFKLSEFLEITPYTLGCIIATIHTYIIYTVCYTLLFTEPLLNPYYYHWKNSFWIFALSNYVLNGCILIKIEKKLFNDKYYLGPHNMLIKPIYSVLNINNYKIKKNIQSILMGSAFIIIIIYSEFKYSLLDFQKNLINS